MKRFLFTLFLLLSVTISFAQDSITQKLLTREFLQYLIEKRYEQAALLFDNNNSQKYNAVNLKKKWLGLQSQAGGFKVASGFELDKSESSVIVTCEFQYITLNLKASFDKENKISEILFLPFNSNLKDSEYSIPSYAKKRRIREEEIFFKTDVFLIPGVLTRPKCKRKPPLVILAHDFGPFDRDASVGPNKIFKDLAYGLASKGIAVIRYDKRSFIYAARMTERYGDKITIMEETIADVITAINFSKTLKQVNPDKIYVLGHGISGMVAPRIASMKTGLAGIIIMAGNARPLEDVLLEQFRYLSEINPAEGGLTEAEKVQLYALEDQVMVVKDPHLTSDTPASDLPLNLSGSYWIDMKNYNQISAAKNAKIPMLFLQGQRDYQVTITDFSIWEKELENSEQVSFKLYSELNHWFLEGKGQSVPNEYEIKGNIPSYVISDIAKWIKKKKLNKE